jgi:hypothetical protein
MNLDAPILPGKSAAGINLGSSIRDVIAVEKPDRIQQLMACDTFTFGPVKIWAGKNGLITEICVGNSCNATTPQGVRVGMNLRQIEQKIGEPYEDEEDVLQIRGIPGLALETTPWKEEYSSHAGRFDPDAVVTHLFVFPAANGEQGVAPNA